VQFNFPAFLLGQFPGLDAVDILIGGVGEQHDFAHGFAEFARFVKFGNPAGRFLNRLDRRQVGVGRRQLAVEPFGDEAGRAAGDVDILADQVGIDARREVFEVEVDVFHRRRQLGGVVIAQPFRVEAGIEIALGGDEGAARFRHLGAVDRKKAVREDFGRRPVAGVLQFGRPEQRVEVEDVLADEMVELGLGIGLEILVEVEAVAGAQILERTHVANRRVEPDVEIFARRIGDFKAEIGCVARNIPVGQLVFARRAEPFLHFVGRFILQHAVVAAGVLAQKAFAARVGKLEEVMFRRAQFRLGAGNS